MYLFRRIKVVEYYDFLKIYLQRYSTRENSVMRYLGGKGDLAFSLFVFMIFRNLKSSP
jgi:hypothetical protein